MVECWELLELIVLVQLLALLDIEEGLTIQFGIIIHLILLNMCICECAPNQNVFTLVLTDCEALIRKLYWLMVPCICESSSYSMYDLMSYYKESILFVLELHYALLAAVVVLDQFLGVDNPNDDDVPHNIPCLLLESEVAGSEFVLGLLEVAQRFSQGVEFGLLDRVTLLQVLVLGLHETQLLLGVRQDLHRLGVLVLQLVQVLVSFLYLLVERLHDVKCVLDT